jgi:hypothetical protein
VSLLENSEVLRCTTSALDSTTQSAIFCVSHKESANIDFRRKYRRKKNGISEHAQKLNIKKDHLKATKYGNLVRQLICVPWIGFVTATSPASSHIILLFIHDAHNLIGLYQELGIQCTCWT